MTIALALSFALIFVVRWLVRRAMRGVVRSAAEFAPRVQIAKLHMMDADAQFKVFHTERIAQTPSDAFEKTFGTADASRPQEEGSLALQAAIAQALAARNAPPKQELAAPAARAFGRRQAG